MHNTTAEFYIYFICVYSIVVVHLGKFPVFFVFRMVYKSVISSHVTRIQNILDKSELL